MILENTESTDIGKVSSSVSKIGVIFAILKELVLHY